MVVVDREEITVVGQLPALDGDFDDDAARAAAESGRISRFREETRDERIEVARQAEHRYGRKVAWGAKLGSTEELFTTLSVPVMTRLRQEERLILDTLVDAGVARSRSEALAWAVRLVGEHADEWLGSLREAMSKVDDLRAQGPEL
jgi:Arc/MetJ-type ribon-helix-helix transcriptional regulator